MARISEADDNRELLAEPTGACATFILFYCKKIRDSVFSSVHRRTCVQGKSHSAKGLRIKKGNLKC